MLPRARRQHGCMHAATAISRAHMPVLVLAVARARACPCNLCLRGAHTARRMSGHVPALGPMSPC